MIMFLVRQVFASSLDVIKCGMKLECAWCSCTSMFFYRFQEITMFRKADKQRKPVAGHQTHRSMMQHTSQPKEPESAPSSGGKEEKEEEE